MLAGPTTPAPHCHTRYGQEMDRVAYDHDFADGGGDRGDLFAVPRRQLLASTRASNQPTPPVPTQPARPLPSSWPLPTYQVRPSRWSRRLLILTQAEAQGWITRVSVPPRCPGPEAAKRRGKGSGDCED